MVVKYFDDFTKALGACRDRSGVLGDEGVVYPPRDEYGYDATPRNAVTFGAMGVDGVHYAVLRSNGELNDDSPVIQIAPMDFSDPYSVLADSFLEYLAIGCGVKSSEMECVFSSERVAGNSLVPFLKKHFDHSRIWNRERDRSIDRYRRLLDLRE